MLTQGQTYTDPHDPSKVYQVPDQLNVAANPMAAYMTNDHQFSSFSAYFSEEISQIGVSLGVQVTAASKAFSLNGSINYEHGRMQVSV